MDLFLTMTGEPGIGTANGFCNGTANLWQIIGYILLIFKIAIPVLLIIFGMIDLGKAVIASKDDEIKKATTALVKRAIASVFIFLLPTIIGFIMTIITDFTNNAQADFNVCKDCITSPNGNTCKSKASNAWK